MSKDKISDYSSTANSNTDIAAINIDEGCAPSGINNAIRALMAQLKNFQTGASGDSFNGPVGSTTASTGAFTTLTTTSTINGLTVGKGAGAVSTNTAVGASALASGSLSGGLNTAVGYVSLSGNTTGASNSGFGYGTLASNTIGASNVAVGTYALNNSTTASNNTAIGYQAGYAVSTVSNSTAVGYQALYTGGGGADVAIGKTALYAATGSSGQNTAVGFQAGAATTSGYNNVFVGYNSAVSNTTGTYNTALGVYALNSNTTASNNTAVGYQASYTSTTATSTTAVGYQAGYSLTTGNYNTLVGSQTGYSLTTGTGNTFIGTNVNTYCGGLVTTGSKNTILGGYNGNQGGLDIRTSSNRIVLSDGDGVPRLYADGDWLFNVGTGGNPAFGLGVQNSRKWLFWNNTGGSDVLNIVDADFTNGVSLSQNSNSWGAYSDQRLKQNIVGLESGLDVVLNLEPVTYEWKAQSKPDVGFIAQQVRTAIPMAVFGNEDDFLIGEDGRVNSPLAIMHDKLIPYMVKAIQELNAKVDAQAAEIAALKGQA